MCSLKKEEVYLEPIQTSMIEFFCENSQRFLAHNYPRKRTPPYMFDWVLNTPLEGFLKISENSQ